MDNYTTADIDRVVFSLDLAEKQSFTWFLKQSNHSTLESSIHLSFIRVSSPTNFDLRVSLVL